MDGVKTVNNYLDMVDPNNLLWRDKFTVFSDGISVNKRTSTVIIEEFFKQIFQKYVLYESQRPRPVYCHKIFMGQKQYHCRVT